MTTIAEAPAKVQVSAVVSGGVPPYSIVWNFGDGSASMTGTTATHTFTAAGSFNITAVVTDSLGATLSGEVTLSIITALMAAVSVNNPTSEVGVGNTFTASPSAGQSPYTVTWNFGDGASGSGATATHTYQAAGTYTVTATITDALGYSTAVTLAISVEPGLSLAIQA